MVAGLRQWIESRERASCREKHVKCHPIGPFRQTGDKREFNYEIAPIVVYTLTSSHIVVVWLTTKPMASEAQIDEKNTNLSLIVFHKTLESV